MSSLWMETLCFIKGQTDKPSTNDVKAKYHALFREGAPAPAETDSDSDSDSSDGGDGDDDGGDDWALAANIDATEPRLEVEVGDAEAVNVAAAATAARA